MRAIGRPRRGVAPVTVSASLGVKGDPATERAIAQLGEAVSQLGAARQAYLDVDLVVGTNRLNHGFQRPVLGVSVMPYDTDATFAWSYDPAQPDNPHPDRQAWLTVAGSAMRARVFFIT